MDLPQLSVAVSVSQVFGSYELRRHGPVKLIVKHVNIKREKLEKHDPHYSLDPLAFQHPNTILVSTFRYPLHCSPISVPAAATSPGSKLCRLVSQC